ncbi:MAG TPA: SurA N-terminal domain-containing protein, partial [Acidobacteriaceae bacterium]|nr:SurA N-terminal domain-containing protein [Acidobacteriaceae bacterium]
MQTRRKLRQVRYRLRWRVVARASLLCALFCINMWGARIAAQAQSSQPLSSTELDHVVAVVGEQAILQSDVEDEMRFTALQSATLPASDNTPQSALNRLIDRALIDNERALQPTFSVVSDAQVQQSIADLKKNLPACEQDACSTDKGWQAVLQTEGFTPQEVSDRLRERLQVLKFIDWRFGSTIRISQKEVQDYYQQVLLPEFARNKVSAPPLKKVSARIWEILLQQHITALLDDWLKNLRNEGK